MKSIERSSPLTHAFLNKVINGLVLVKLRGGREIRGILKQFDQHLNLVLEQAEEIDSKGGIRRLGTIIIRGDNVIFISPVTH